MTTTQQDRTKLFTSYLGVDRDGFHVFVEAFITTEDRPQTTVTGETEVGLPRLSISGWTLRKGRYPREVSGGQIQDSLSGMRKIADGWTAVDIGSLRVIWNRWHLNDLRPGCVHQMADGWDKRPIDPEKPTNTYGKHFEGQQSDTWNLLGWIRPSEHPDGLMTKPCPECGYRYGTAWLVEPIPAEVWEEIDRLSKLPHGEIIHGYEG